MTPLVFDNTPLSHFARAGVLPVLENITASFQRIVPAEVLQELIRGIPYHPALAAAVSLPWITIVELGETEDNIEIHGTLWLVTNGIRSGKLSEAEAITVIDQLAATNMALPTDGVGFIAWAREEGLLS